MSFSFLKAPNARFVGIAPHKLSASLKDFMALNKEVETPDVYHLWLLYSVSKAMGSNIAWGPERSLFTVTVKKGEDEEVISILDPDSFEGITESAKPNILGPEDVQVLSANVQPMAALMFQLVGCLQVKPLKQSNLKGYHASSGNLPTFSGELEALRYISSLTPPVTANDEFVGLRTSKKFLAYHSTATSTPSLLLEAHNSMPSFLADLITEEAVEAAEAAKANFASLDAASRIPTFAIAVAWLWFEATGQDRGGDKWYQGKKAVDEMAAHTLIKVRAAMKLYIKAQKVVGDDATAEDIIASLGFVDEK